MPNEKIQQKGLVSVIMPTYNRAHFILDAISSVFRQTYRPIQLLVVDDGSSDETERIVREWAEEHAYDTDFRLDFVVQERSGACAARNRGILRGEGEFFVFLDSDDILFPHALEWAAEGLADPEIEYIYFRVHRSDLNLTPLPGDYVGQAPTGTNADICLYLWHTMGAIYRRSMIERIGFWNQELNGSQDWEFAARVKMAAAKFAFDQRVIGLFRDHPFGRIGVKRFKHDYVRSVEIACDSIRKHAEAVGRLDDCVRLALAKRLFIHAVEFGAHGHFEDKDRLLRKADDLVGGGEGAFQLFLQVFRHLNSRGLSRGSLLLHRMRSSMLLAGKGGAKRFPAVLETEPTEIVESREVA